MSDLARQGLIETTRGRGGGLRLSKEPGTILIGDVVRASETDLRLVECFDGRTNACTLTTDCRLKHLFDAALHGSFHALDGATPADLTSGPREPETLPGGPAVRSQRAVAVPMPSSARPLPRARARARR